MNPLILSALQQHARGRGLNVQAFTRTGKPLGPVPEAPLYCRPPAATPRGAQHCDRGCGAAIAATEPGRPPRIVHCPFGALCAVVGVAGPAPGESYVLVGGRAFEDYGRYAAFVDTVVTSGVSLQAMLTASENVPFRTGEDLTREMKQLAHLLEKDLADGAASHAKADEPSAGAPRRAEPSGVTAARVTVEPNPAAHPRPERSRSVERTRALRDFLQSVSGRREPEDLFRAVVNGFSAFTGARRVSLFIYDPRTRDLALADAVGLPEKAMREGIRRPAFSGVMGAVFQDLSAVFVEDMDAQSIHPPSPHPHESGRSYACLPLCARHRGLGVLNATEKADGSAFSGEDFLWMETLTGVVAMALERRLLEDALEEAGSPAAGAATVAEEEEAEYIDDDESELHASSLGNHQPLEGADVAVSAFDREAS